MTSHAANRATRRSSRVLPLSEPSRLALWALVTLCLLVVWLLVYLLGISRLQQARDQHLMYSKFREQLAAATAPVGGAMVVGEPVALLQGPHGLRDQVVVEGTTAGNLRSGPGHVRSTPLPGQAGVSMIYGRATSFGGPFGDLSSFERGDIVVAVTGEGSFKYRVDDVRHAGDTVPAAPASRQSRLTLASISGGSLSNAWSSTNVIYVDATMQGIVAPTPAGRPNAIQPNEELLAVDAAPFTLMSMILWLQALLIAIVAMIWARRRWGAQQSWLIGVPIVCAALWGLTSTASQVLPNVL